MLSFVILGLDPTCRVLKYPLLSERVLLNRDRLRWTSLVVRLGLVNGSPQLTSLAVWYIRRKVWLVLARGRELSLRVKCWLKLANLSVVVGLRGLTA